MACPVLYGAQTQQFTATASNAGGSGITWNVTPGGVGTISSSGLYTAPSSISTLQQITITATSVANPAIAGTTSIWISPQPFVLYLPASTVRIGPGTFTGISFIELAADGFVHSLQYSVSGLPNGVTGTFSAGGTLNLTADSTAIEGSYTATVTANDLIYPPLSQSKSFTVIVTGGFSVAVSSPTITTVAGATFGVTLTQSVTSDFTGIPVSYPAGGGCSFGGFPLWVQTGAGTNTLFCKIAADMPPGTYLYPITGRNDTLGESTSATIAVNVVAPTGPSFVSMSPNPGTQTTQIFNIGFTDTSGVTNLTSTGILVNTSSATASACYVLYSAGTQTVSLRNDADTGWVGSAALGTAGTLANSQCVLDTGASAVSTSGSTLTLTLVVTPVNPTIGLQNVYAIASDNSATSGWLLVGAWAISENSLPNPWRDQDIGGTGPRGTGFATYYPVKDPNTNVFTLTATTTAATYPPDPTSDSFHFTYQPMQGDGAIVARFLTPNPYQYLEGGVMIRASTDPGSAFVRLSLQPFNSGCGVAYRSTSGTAATYSSCANNVSTPIWLRITRQGSTFGLQTSPDGTTWTDAADPISISMPSNVLVGLAATSNLNTALIIADFDNVAVTLGSATATPSLSPIGGTYASAQTVSISSATPGASIRYTLDGSTPTEAVGTLYSGAITVSATTTIKAIAYAFGAVNSAVATAVYNISAGGEVAAPTFSVSSGTYSSAQTVAISSATTGASIRYTTDGSVPTSSSGLVYSSPVSVSSSLTLKAIAYMAGMSDSTVASATYTINSGPTWYSTGGTWSHRKAITIDHTKVSGSSSLSNFPVLIKTTDADLESSASGGKSDGTDILFTSSDGVTKLDHEVENYVSTTGEIEAWVRVPSLSNSADTVIYAYYGNASASNQQNASGVWDSDYLAVYHLNQSPGGSAPQLLDSTSNGTHLTVQTGNEGSQPSPSSTTGKIGGSVYFPTTTQFNGTYASSSVNSGAGTGLALTAEAWVNIHSNITRDLDSVDIGFGTFSFWSGFGIFGDYYNGSFPSCLAVLSSAGVEVVPTTVTFSTGVDYHIVCTLSSSQLTMYVNGTQVGSTAFSDTMPSDTPLLLNSGIRYLDNRYDEARYSKTTRSADWIATEYNNQNDSGSFYRVGSQSEIGVPQQAATPTFSVSAGTYSSAQAVTISSATMGASIRYTTDGSVPTSSTGTVYTTPVSISSSLTLKAIAYESGMTDRGVASATYTIASGSWYASGGTWSHRKAITIDHTKVSGSSSLSNFPVLIKTTDADLESSASGGKSDGTDILFTSSDGVTKLDHEVENYISTTGEIEAWVRVPSLSNSTDTVIYAYYGNALASNQQNATGVWDSDYLAVYHLSQNPGGTAPQLLDSTANGTHLTVQTGNEGSQPSPSSTTGKIAGSVYFPTTTQFNGTYASSSVNSGAGTGLALTAEAWVNIHSNILTDLNSVNVAFGTFASYTGFGIGGEYFTGAFPTCDAFLPPGQVAVVPSGVTFSTGASYHIVCTLTSSQLTMYVNGVSVGSSAISSILPEDGLVLLNQGSRYRDNQYDEARYSKTTRSADWIATEYNNQNDSGSFYSVGSQQ